MIMIGDRKRTVTQILGEEKVEEPRKEALHAIAEEMISCVQEGDAEGLKNCLKAAFEACKSGD